MGNDLAAEREKSIEHLKLGGFLKSGKVEKAMMAVPREEFVQDNERDCAYDDTPKGIGFSQTISAPHMVALMTELLELKKNDTVLEVGGGSGYQAAVLAKLVRQVYSIELEQGLVDFAEGNLKRAGIRGVEIIQGDGSKGLPEKAPFDKVIVACGCHDVPKPLFKQLEQGGILVAPVGGSRMQYLKKYQKTSSGIRKESHGGCIFVPLRH